MGYQPTDWEDLPSENTPVISNALDNMEAGITQNDTILGAEDYDSTSTYEIGDFCVYNKTLYRCTTTISTAEAWNSSHWTATSVEAELDALRKSGGIPTNSVIGYDGSTIPSGFEETDGPNDYSTTEKVIGKWIGGKPLYRKVYNTYTLESETPGTSAVYLIDTIPNIELKDRKANIITEYNSTYYYQLGLGNNGTVHGSFRIGLNSNGNYLRVTRENYNTSYSIYKMEVIIEYTKTTD